MSKTQRFCQPSGKEVSSSIFKGETDTWLSGHSTPTCLCVNLTSIGYKWEYRGEVLLGLRLVKVTYLL